MRQAVPRIGIDLLNEGRRAVLSGPDIVELAGEAERAGFDSVWMNEDVGHDSLAVLSAVAATTRRVELGTAIVNVYTRSALQIAMAIATLDELSGGRAVLGLSVGRQPWIEPGHGMTMEAPLARVREYVEFIRKALTGEPFKHDGRFLTGVDIRLAFRPARADLPIYLAGVRPRIVELAGQVADGLILNVVGADYLADFAADHFRQAARQAGRAADDLEIMAIVTCCLAEQPAEALADARRMFIRRLSTSPPAKMLATQRSEFHEEIRYLKGLLNAGQRERAEEEASDALAQTIVVAGGPEEVQRGIERYFAAGCTRVILASWPRDAQYVRRLLGTLGAEAPVDR
jgi:5,10-methylenetetrahydromethanopterin reductase